MGPVVVMSSAPGARFRGLAGELCHARENGTFRTTSQTFGRGSALKRGYKSDPLTLYLQSSYSLRGDGTASSLVESELQRCSEPARDA